MICCKKEQGSHDSPPPVTTQPTGLTQQPLTTFSPHGTRDPSNFRLDSRGSLGASPLTRGRPSYRERLNSIYGWTGGIRRDRTGGGGPSVRSTTSEHPYEELQHHDGRPVEAQTCWQSCVSCLSDLFCCRPSCCKKEETLQQDTPIQLKTLSPATDDRTPHTENTDEDEHIYEEIGGGAYHPSPEENAEENPYSLASAPTPQ